MHRIIINTLNLRLGGAFQRSISFVENLEIVSDDLEIHIFCTAKYFEFLKLRNNHLIFHIFKYESNNFRFWLKTIKDFRSLEKKIDPDLVFSFVGPAYIKPRAKHLVGFALPQIVYHDNPFVKNFDLKNRILFLLKSFVSKYEADYYVVQTEDVKSRLINVFNLNRHHVFKVSNGIGRQFEKFVPSEKNTLSRFNSRTLILISGYRDNKNFEIFPEVIEILNERGFKVKFIVTLDKSNYLKYFKPYKDFVQNVGKVNPKEIQKLYAESSALFIPSFLECFSASYCEAMHMGLPILASNYSFSTTICGDSALYFDPYKPRQAAEKIIELFQNYELYKDLSTISFSKKDKFPDSIDQTTQYLDIIYSLINDVPLNTTNISN